MIYTATTSYAARYTFSAKEKDEETGYSVTSLRSVFSLRLGKSKQACFCSRSLRRFGARYYNSDLSIWLSVDPMSDKYPNMSPYVYCADNPVKLVDPDGRELNPIFSTEGKLLGTDNAGWKGTAIVMNKNNFRQGMKHCDAEMRGTYLNRYGKGIKISDSDWKKVEDNGGKRMSPSVENHSNEGVFFKPETTYNKNYKNDGAYQLAAGKDLYMPVDGVATSKYNDNVGKIPTGASVTITNEGGLNIDYHGFGEMIRLLSDYGWVNRNWQKKQQMNGDHSWDNLFGKAAQIGRRSY